MRHISLLAGLVLAAAFLVTSAVSAQRGAYTKAQNLAEMEAEAGVIVQGRVESAIVEPHPAWKNLWTIVIRLRVEENIKGPAGDSYSFRQFIWDPRDRLDAAGYKKGQRLLLLLTKPNAEGLSSPVGLEQGRFRIGRDAQGNEVAHNGRGNAGLFSGVDATAARRNIRFTAEDSSWIREHRAGAVPGSDLRRILRRLVEGK